MSTGNSQTSRPTSGVVRDIASHKELDVDPSPADTTDSEEIPQDVEASSRKDRIAARAHELFLERGGTHGSHEEDWLQAERELDRAKK